MVYTSYHNDCAWWALPTYTGRQRWSTRSRCWTFLQSRRLDVLVWRRIHWVIQLPTWKGKDRHSGKEYKSIIPFLTHSHCYLRFTDWYTATEPPTDSDIQPFNVVSHIEITPIRSKLIPWYICSVVSYWTVWDIMANCVKDGWQSKANGKLFGLYITAIVWRRWPISIPYALKVSRD